MTAGSYEYDFFISYADDARWWVRGYLEKILRRAKKTYLLEDDFVIGQSPVKAAEEAIMLSRKILFVMTPQHVASRLGELVEQMVHYRGAEEGKWPLVPIMLEPVDRKLLQRSMTIIDLTDALGKADAELRLLQGLGVTGGAGEGDDVPPQSPYPGMEPFDDRYVQYFFGRDDQVRECLFYLQNNRFLVLIGSSGCGKSSLVRAGIVPSLARNKGWLAKILRPRDGTFAAWCQQYSKEVFEEPDKLVNCLLAEKPGSQNLLVVVDQFEEIFTFDQQDAGHKQHGLGVQAQFFLQRLAALRSQENVSIILTVRDEFYGQLSGCAEWLDIDRHLMRVGPLGRKGLADAIRRPAAKVGVWIQDTLIERLVNDAGDDPGILPFVQETMNLLWATKTEFAISLKQYEALAKDGVSGLRYAIAAKADAAFNALPTEAHRSIARRIFIRLVQFGENGRPDTRRLQPLSSLQATQDPPGVFEETLQYLSSDRYRLLTLHGEEQGNGAVVDIVHESLISNRPIAAWPTLREWLDSFKDCDAKRRIFVFKLNEWMRLGCGDAGGLLDKREIKELDEWLNSSCPSICGIDEGLEDFFVTSRKHIDPGWNFFGGVNLVVLTTTVALFLAGALFYINYLNDPFLRMVIAGTVLSLVFTLVAFFVISEKDYTFRFKKYTHNLSRSIYVAIVYGLFFSLIGFWGGYLYGEMLRYDYCNDHSWVKNESLIQMCVINNGSMENLNIYQVLRNFKKLNVFYQDKKDFEKCQDRCDFSVDMIIMKKDNTSGYDAKLFELKNKRFILIEPFYEFTNDKDIFCNVASELGYRVVQAIGAHDYIKTINDSKSYFKRVTCKAFAENELAVNAYNNHDYSEAEKHAQLAVSLMGEGQFPVANRTLGIVQARNHKYDEAIKNLRIAVKHVPVSDFYVVLGMALHQQGILLDNKLQLDQALGFYEKALLLDGNNLNVYHLLSSYYLDLGENTAAELILAKMNSVIKWDDEQDEIWKMAYYKNMGIFFFFNKDYVNAIENLEMAANLGADYEEEINYFKGKVYVEMGNEEKACIFLSNYLLSNNGDDYLKGKRKKEVGNRVSECGHS